MQYQPIPIIGYQSGLKKNKKPLLLINDAFQILENAYVFRDSVRKRSGIKLVGRLRRCFETPVTLSTQADGASYTNADILADASFNLRATEPDANIEPGSVEITVGALVFVEPATPDGTLSAGGNHIGTINYVTGELNLTFDPALGAPTDVDVEMCYFPSLPAMGIDSRELGAINDEQTAFFDTTYVYTYDDNDFTSPSSTTWSGSNSDFFWMANYRGVEPQDRVFYVTNFASPTLSTNNRIRYTMDMFTWTDFTPATAGTQVTNENVGTVIAPPGNAFVGNLANTNIIPGSVHITVSNSTEPPVGFRDQVTTYPNGTLNGSPSTSTGTINYTTGAITLSIDPAFTMNATVFASYQHESSFIYQTELIIPYYGRLLFLNTWEGGVAPGPNPAANAVNFYNRLRFSQIGNPLERNAWVTTVFGKGGFIDAPTNEAIVSTRFYKNTLIVFFERSTWQVRYVGEYGLPFIWERISSDFGSESTFSTVLFDKGVLAVGDKAIIASSGNDAERIDLDVPDTVFSFQNEEGGKERVHGTRDFEKELVYWTYVEPNSDGSQRVFPNKVLIYNYRNNTWANNRDNVTVFGLLQNASGDSWDLPISWDSETSWDTVYQSDFPLVISGNQQGFIHYYQYPMDPDTIQDNEIHLMEHESLFVKNITRSATAALRFEIPNHNLNKGETIYLANAMFADIATSTALTTSLNDKFYYVHRVEDENNIDVYQWDPALQDYVTTSGDQIGFTPATGTGTYVGGGVIALLPKLDIITKDFSPYQDQGKRLKMGYLDVNTDASPGALVSVNIYVDSNLGEAANLPVWNPSMETSLYQQGEILGITKANPAVITSLNHSLQTGRQITIANVNGMVGVPDINGGLYTITVDPTDPLNKFSLDGFDTTAYTAYSYGGNWMTQDQNTFYVAGSQYAWHRFYSTVFGQYITTQITYNDNLMNSPVTHTSDFQMNAMVLWGKPGGGLTL